MAQKLWEKSVQVNKDIERFTVGRDREMDLYLAKHDVLGSMAHITMLESIGLLTKEELDQLLVELKNIYASAEKGEFVIEDGVEDVHSQVELMLTRRLGDIGKKIHSGRSRNDQVLLDLKLFTRTQIKEVAEAVEQLFHVLIRQSERYKNVLMPGYTHLQIAMPSSFGLWFGAYAESLMDDMLFLQAAFKMCNRNPLASRAYRRYAAPPFACRRYSLLGFRRSGRRTDLSGCFRSGYHGLRLYRTKPLYPRHGRQGILSCHGRKATPYACLERVSGRTGYERMFHPEAQRGCTS